MRDLCTCLQYKYTFLITPLECSGAYIYMHEPGGGGGGGREASRCPSAYIDIPARTRRGGVIIDVCMAKSGSLSYFRFAVKT